MRRFIRGGLTTLYIIIFVCNAFLVTACEENISSSSVGVVASTPVDKISTIVTVSTTLTSALPHTILTFPPASVTMTATNTPDLFTNDLLNTEYRWLLGVPCKLPCWEGITMGQSNSDQVVKALQNNPFITNITTEGLDIGFQWSNKTISGKNLTTNGVMAVRLDNQHTANSIYLLQNVKLGQIIVKYGQPTYVIAVKVLSPEQENPEKSSFTYVLRLLFPNYGLILVTEMYHKYDITVDLIGTPIFVKPDLPAAKDFIREERATILPYQGFNSFDFYCRQRVVIGAPCTNEPRLQ